MRSFELQIYRDGKWKMDSVYDDRDTAIDEAKKTEQRGRYAGVCVVEENYDEATNQTTSRTLFRGGAAKSEKSSKPAKTAKPKSSAPRKGREPESARTREAKPQAKKSNFLVPVLVLLVVLVGGLFALFGIEHLASLK